MNSFFKDLLIIDLSSVLAGPSVAQFLAELGSTVIKIENIKSRGDVTRSWKLKNEDPHSDLSSYFISANWGKKSIAIDLTNSDGQAIVHKLSKKADILIHNFKKDDDKKFNLDYETIFKINPGIIYSQITGFSELSKRTGYDAIIQAESGFVSMNGQDDESIHKMPVALVDVLAAHQLKEAILVSLLKREQNAKGEKIIVSLMDSAISSLVNQASNFLNGGFVPKAIGSDHPNIVPYGTHFKCKDSVVIIFAIGSDKQYELLTKILGLNHLSLDERFLRNQDRVKNKKSLIKLLKNRISELSSDEIYEPCLENNIPVAKVKYLDEVLTNPDFSKLLYRSGKYKSVKQFIASNAEGEIISKPPSFSENSIEILSDYLSYSNEEINDLLRKKIIQA